MSLFDKFKNRSTSPTQEGANDGRVPPGQTLTKGFPVLTYGATQHIEPESWTCRVFGKIGKEHTFHWADLQAMPQTDITVDIHCVTTWSKLDMKWRGVKFSDFLKAIERECGPLPGDAKFVMQHSTGGYTTNTPLEALLDDNVLLAHTYDGAPLAAEHGGPVRLVLPKLYFWKSAKWLNGFEFMEKDARGFWERFGYHNNGDPWREERFG